MNSLSLLIYGISTLLQLNVFLVVLIIAAICGSGAAALIFGLSKDEYSDMPKTAGIPAAKWLKRFITTAVIAGLLLVFIPNERFLVLIAASEVGEMALKQPAVQNAMGAIGGLSSDATNLLKLYIENETKKLADELKPKEDK